MTFISKEYNSITFCTFLEAFENFKEVRYKFPSFFFFLVQWHRHGGKILQSCTAIFVNRIIHPEAQKKEKWHWYSLSELSESEWWKGKQYYSCMVVSWHNLVWCDNLIPGWQSHPKAGALDYRSTLFKHIEDQSWHLRQETPRRFLQAWEKSQVSLNCIPQTWNFWEKTEGIKCWMMHASVN